MPPPRPSRAPVSRSNLAEPPIYRGISTPNNNRKMRGSIRDVQLIESSLSHSQEEILPKSISKSSKNSTSSEKFPKPALPRHLSQGSYSNDRGGTFDTQSVSSINSVISTRSMGGNNSLVHDEEDM